MELKPAGSLCLWWTHKHSEHSISSKVRSSPKKSLNSGWQPVREWRPPTYQRQDGANNIICFSANLQLQGCKYLVHRVIWWWQTRFVETSWLFICVFQRQKQMWIYKLVMCWAIFFQPQGLSANLTHCVITSWWVTACDIRFRTVMKVQITFKHLYAVVIIYLLFQQTGHIQITSVIFVIYYS